MKDILSLINKWQAIGYIGSYEEANLGRPHGLAVKYMRSATGGLGLDTGHALMNRFSSHAEASSHIQQLEGCEAMTYNSLAGLWGKKNENNLKKPFGVKLIQPEFVFPKWLVACIVYLLCHVPKRRVNALKIRL